MITLCGKKKTHIYTFTGTALKVSVEDYGYGAVHAVILHIQVI